MSRCLSKIYYAKTTTKRKYLEEKFRSNYQHFILVWIKLGTCLFREINLITNRRAYNDSVIEFKNLLHSSFLMKMKINFFAIHFIATRHNCWKMLYLDYRNNFIMSTSIVYPITNIYTTVKANMCSTFFNWKKYKWKEFFQYCNIAENVTFLLFG